MLFTIKLMEGEEKQEKVEKVRGGKRGVEVGMRDGWRVQRYNTA